MFYIIKSLGKYKLKPQWDTVLYLSELLKLKMHQFTRKKTTKVYVPNNGFKIIKREPYNTKEMKKTSLQL